MEELRSYPQWYQIRIILAAHDTYRRIGDIVIKFNSSVKYLGVCVNDTMTYKEGI